METANKAIVAILEALLNEHGSAQVIEQTNIIENHNGVMMVINGSINVNGSIGYYDEDSSLAEIYEYATRLIKWADRTKDENKTDKPV